MAGLKTRSQKQTGQKKQPDALIDFAHCRLQALDLVEKSTNGVMNGMPDETLRRQLLDHLKDVSIRGRKRAEIMLFEDGDGARCAKRIAALQDFLVRLIHEIAVNHLYRVDNPSAGERLAIAAVGGYGRGTLAPGSDIDLLFIFPFKQTPWCEQVVEFILYFLWDMGFKLGHATRNLDECIRLAADDMTIRTSVLEARFITGEKPLFDELEQRFDRQILRHSAADFIAAKLAERDERHERVGQSRYLIEPNVKDGKGGMRDLHTLFWIGKYTFQLRRQRDLVDAGLFTATEFRNFKRAEKFLWTVRCHMHFLTGKAEERLSFDLQREMAARLKYNSHGGLKDVERFMKHYFLTAKLVGDLTLIVCSRLELRQQKSVRGINGIISRAGLRRKKIKGSADFINDHGRINIAHKNVFIDDPINFLRLYKLADDNNLDIHPEANYRITQSLKLAGPALRADDKANQLFLKILTSRNRPEFLLRKMNESGLLGRFIPAFGKIVAMMQFSMYHHYTVDEHLIRSVGVLSALENGRLAEEHPLSAVLLPQVKDRAVLYLALLIHDIAKGRKEDHSIAGEKLAKRLCPRLGLTDEQSRLVAWLVREHLTMSMIAQSRDLTDNKTIADFARIVQTVERMRYLLILTVCDIRAVGPGVWNGWKGQLLRTLYYETEPRLTGGFSSIDRHRQIEERKAKLVQSLEDWDEETRKKLIDLPFASYFLSIPLDDQVRHMEMLHEAGKNIDQITSFKFRALEFEAVTEITILSLDHPRLLSIFAGACAAIGANIADARIHTISDGRALDTIFINRVFDNDRDEIRRAERIGELIIAALCGEVQLPLAIEQRKKAKSKLKSGAFSVAAKARIDNELSNEFSVIEIECLDRSGLLFELTRAMASIHLNIHSAHITTFGEKAIDSFYVTDLTGQKIVNRQRQQKIIKCLTEVIKPEKHSERKIAR